MGADLPSGERGSSDENDGRAQVLAASAGNLDEARDDRERVGVRQELGGVGDASILDLLWDAVKTMPQPGRPAGNRR